MDGLDQVSLRTAAELCHLKQLDPKLWVALSCSASGLEFDERTLAWWEVPLVFLAVFFARFRPVGDLGWLKLHRRAAGPLLEASGWAVNSRIPIGLALGGRLTDRAVFPDNAIRNYNDPLESPRVGLHLFW